MDKTRTFGSLHTGRGMSSLRPDECPVFRNVQHDKDGRTRKRRGFALTGEVALAPMPDCWHQEVVNDEVGMLELDAAFAVRLTHVTLAGETDIIRQPSQLFETEDLAQLPDLNALKVWHPFHMRKMGVATWHDLPATTPGLPVNPQETTVTDQGLGVYGGGPVSYVIGVPGEDLAPRSIKPGSVVLFFDGGGGTTLVDDGAGAITGPGVDAGTINYETGQIHITWTVEPAGNVDADFILLGAGRVYMLELEDGPPLEMLESCPDAFEGFLVYSRAPRIQDQTGFGANFEAAEPLYHRVRPLAKVFAFASYLGNPVFVLDQDVPQLGQTGKIDRDTVDIMMPDRAGLPVLWWNVYIAPGPDFNEFRWAGAGTHGARPVTVLEYDEDAARSPLDRIIRDGATVTAQDATDTAADGCARPAHTGIRGGLKAVRTTWQLSEKGVMQAPGWEVAAEELGLGGRRAPLRARQESWPSRVRYVEVQDGQQIDLTRVDPMPDTVSGWNVYVGECAAHRVLDFEDSERIVGNINPFEHVTPYAEHAEDPADPDSEPAFPDGFTEFENDNAFPAQPASDLDARGFPPAYEQIPPHVEPSDGAAEDWRFASSDDTAEVNRHRFWFQLDAVTDSDDHSLTRHVVLRLKLRVRPGKLATYSPATAKSVSIRVWWESDPGWRVLKGDLGPSGGFVDHNIPITLGGSSIAPLFAKAAAPSRRYAIVDIIGLNSVGFDHDEPTLALYRQEDVANDDISALEPESDDETLQLEAATAETVSLRHPLAQRMWWNRLIRQDNTASWPLQLYAEPIPGNRGPQGQTIQRVVGCGDSLFRMKPGGTFERLYQYEGLDYAKVVQDDFQFCNYLWRLFACNPGLSAWNLRFDQQQTFPMGIATPVQTGAITSVHEPAPGVDVVEDVAVEYYIVFVRTVLGGNGYVTRSAPLLFTPEPAKVNLKEGFDSACLVEGTVRPEPQVVAIEVYRNLVDTTFYKRADTIKIEEAVVEADGSVRISVEDVFDGTDGDLDIELQFDTGRPPASTMLLFHRGRVHGVAQTDRERSWFSNVTSPSGLSNPEGWHDQNTIDPPLKIASAITALTGSDGPLRISTLKGMARADGVSDDQDGAEAFSTTAISADTGWIGPRAWHESNDIEYGMTVFGPAKREGDQLYYGGSPAKDILDRALLDARIAYGSWVAQDVDGRLLFSFTDDPVGAMNGAFMLHEHKLGDGIEPHWSEWRLKAHSSCLVDSYTGKQVVLLGGHDGRIYRLGGRFRTDAGLFIPARMKSRPEKLAGPSRAARPDTCNWHLHGDRQDVVLVTIRKDMEIQRPVNTRPQRIRCNVAPVNALSRPIPLFGVGAHVPGDGTEYGLPEAREAIVEPTRLGGTFHEIQFEVYQELDDMPVGTRREAGFDLEGYVLTADPRGIRRSAA